MSHRGHIRRKKRQPPSYTVIPVSNVVEPETTFDVDDGGEKLYVTKDKRRPTSWRRCLSWIVACTVISVVLIVAILAGTGVILNQEQNLVKEASIGRNFAGSNLKPSVTQSSGSPIPTGTKAMLSPADMYVPRSIESELLIDNMNFDPALLDTNSSAYRQFSTTMEDQLKMILFDKETLEFGASDIGLRIVNVSRDPFKVNYRIGWNHKQGASNPPEPIKMEDIKRRLVESLARNQGYIDKYHIDGEGIKVDYVIDTCQMSNGGCSHICYYNYLTQLFTCTCPTHLVLDESKKNCIAWTGDQDALPVPERPAYPGGDNVHEYEFDMHQQHGLHQGIHHDLDHQHEAGQPAPEPEPTSGLSGGHQGHGYEHEPNAEPAPEPTAEPSSNGSYEGKPQHTMDHNSDDKHWSHSGVYVHPDSKEHEPAAEPTPEPNSDDKNWSYSGTHGHSDGKDHEPVAEPTPEPNSEGEHWSQSGVYTHSGSKEHEPAAEPTPEPNSDDKHLSQSGIHTQSGSQEHQPSAEPNSEGKQWSGVYTQSGSKDHEPAAEPTPEPNSDDKHWSQSGVYTQSGSQEHQPEAESDSEGKHWSGGHTQSGSKDHEPAREHGDHKSNTGVYVLSGPNRHEAAAEPTPEPNSDGEHWSQSGSKEHEPAAEPTPEPNSDDKHWSQSGVHTQSGTKEHETGAEQNSEGKQWSQSGVYTQPDSKEHEPSAEPTPEPNSDDKDGSHIHSGSKGHEASADSGDKNWSNSGVYVHPDSKDHEPSAEPTPEPSSDDKDGSHIHSGSKGLEASPDSGDNNWSNSGVYAHPDSKDHEPSAEPTPEPSADDKDGSHVHPDSKEPEASAEPTPEPSSNSEGHELGAQSGSPSQSNTKGSHSDIYVNPESKQHEPTSESSSSYNNDKSKGSQSGIQGLPGLQDHESSTELTPETNSETKIHSSSSEPIMGTIHETQQHEPKSTEMPSPAFMDHEHVPGQSMHFNSESKHYKPGMETSSGSNDKEHAIGATSQPSVERDNLHGSQGSKTESHSGGGHFETTISPDGSSNSNNQHPTHAVPYLEQILINDSNSHQGEHPGSTGIGFDKNNGSYVDSTNPTKHILHDVLIKESNLRPSDHQSQPNSTWSPGQDVSGGAKGEPVIEEVIVNKPHPSATESHFPQTIMPHHNIHGGEDSNYDSTTKPTNFDGSVTINPSGVIRHETDENSTDLPTLMGNHPGSIQSSQSNTKNEHPEIDENATIQPKIIEYEVMQGSKSGGGSGIGSEQDNQTTKKNMGDDSKPNATEHPFFRVDAQPGSQQHLTTSTPENQSHSNEMTNEDKNSSNEGSTTIRPRHETFTVPVSILAGDFPTDFENYQWNRKVTTDGSGGEMPHATELPVHAGGSAVDVNSNTPTTSAESDGKPLTDSKKESVNTGSDGDQIFSNGFVRTVTEHLPDEKTAISGINHELTPEGKVHKEEVNSKNEDHGKKTEHNEESNETTKTPEELSNNIKDEGLDNEEFNTLIDKDYDKSGRPGDVKEILVNKYSNKVLKGDKKKLKDYVRGDKTEANKKGETTVKPAVTTEDFILQKHVNGNENHFDTDYRFQNEHTTKGNEDITIIDSHNIEGIPGVSLKPHGINNHDISILQTVAPDFTVFPGTFEDGEANKSDPKIKSVENKDGDVKSDKEYPKFDKDYNKFEKQKGSKKKDLKKKVGGKDGKNVEIEDGRKYFTEIGGKEYEVTQDGAKDIMETTLNPSFEKVTVAPDEHEIGVRIHPKAGSSESVTQVPEGKLHGIQEATIRPSLSESDKAQTTLAPGMGDAEHSGQSVFGTNVEGGVGEHGHHTTHSISVEGGVIGHPGERHRVEITTSQGATNIGLPGTVYDGHFPEGFNHSDPNFMFGKSSGEGNLKDLGSTSDKGTLSGAVSDGVHKYTVHGSVSGQRFGPGDSRGNTEGSSFEVYTSSDSLPKNFASGINFSNSSVFRVGNSSTAHPTIVVHGQSGSLQDGHLIRFGNGTTIPGVVFNGTLIGPDGHSFSFTNYTTTFPNGSAVHPTIVVRGQSGALQDGHESRFFNTTYRTVVTAPNGFTTNLTDENGHQIFFGNSTTYRVEGGGSLPESFFNGAFNGSYHTFTNSSGTFIYTNTSQPSFFIKGDSGDFGNTKAYILGNVTKSFSSGNFTGPQRTRVVFRNSTVFSVSNSTGNGGSTVEIQEVAVHPHDTIINETIKHTHQLNPNSLLSGTAYQVNNYFGYISKCAAGQFQCVNGTSKRGSACISLSSKCDSINDCSDGSDELGCIENGCPGNFQCSDGTCLKRHLVCNGIVECSDGSDEKNCESWKCEFDEFQCPSGRCIPVVWQCDNKPDCDNHTDEYNCQTSCGNDEYLCPEGWCIPLTYKCNGIKECSNGEDEQFCDCSLEEFRCQTGGCVSKNQVCNGLDDCPDRSDEWGCVKLEPDTNLLKIRTASGDYEPICADNWSSKHSDEVCASLGYFASMPIDNDSNSTITTEKSFYILKNDTTEDFNKKFLVNLKRINGTCSSGKLVEIGCQEFSCGSLTMTDSSSSEARLVGGKSATAGQWPSVALLYNIRNFHSCTANILTPRWVLASYNCLKMGNKNLNQQDWKMFGGSTVFETEKENAETRNIVSIIPHPQVKFNQFLFSNDLALVELDQPLQFTSNVGAVCLPEQEIQPRQICVTAGWGMNSPEDKSIRQQLQYLPVPTMNLTECNSTEHYSGFITDDKICAGFNAADKSLCYNEEGAPLMCINEKSEWELHGVLSYHSHCGRGAHPSIFSSITPVRDWIKETIGNSFDRKSMAATKR